MKFFLLSFLIAVPVFAQQANRTPAGTWEFRSFTQSASGGPVTIEYKATFQIDPNPAPYTAQFSGYILFEDADSAETINCSYFDPNHVDRYNLSCRFLKDGAFSGGHGTLSADGMSMSGIIEFRGPKLGNQWTARRLPGPGAPQILAIANAASGQLGPIAPGQVISIFGSAPTNPIGPAQAAGLELDASGKVATALAGVRVRFLPTDTYAPLLYVSAGQINAVVPYEVAGSLETQLQIEYQGRRSKAVRARIEPVDPGMFASGGQGAILNQDGQVNGPSNPAARGSVVVLFVTGAGQTTPAGVTGKITTASATGPVTPRPVANIAVRVNGEAAQVLFHGEAPGMVSGVVQVNARIPTIVPPGKLPIQVFFAGVASQEGVTVAVK